MVVGPLLLVVLVVVVVIAARRGVGRERAAVTEAHAIRRFFQYLLLFASLVVMAVGVAGLLGRALDQGPVAADDEVALARDLAFTVVGVPLYAGLAVWSRRRLLADPLERGSTGWAFYVTAAAVTSLLVAMTSLQSALAWAFDVGPANPRALGRFVVWFLVWAAHWWLHRRMVPPNRSVVHHLAGSLTGLVTTATGLSTLLGAALAALLLSEGGVPSNRDEAIRGAITLVVGAPVWFLYWVRTAARQDRDRLWLGYVLLPGVAGGLVSAVVSASTVLYTALVWFLGDPPSADAVRHFNDAPWALGAAAAGTAVWWYHQRVLQEAHLPTRTEVRRVYEYLMAAIGLVAAAVGLTMLVVSGIEALTGTGGTAAPGQGAVNTLLASATLLVVGGPVWWFYWHRIQRAFRADPADEGASPTRRAFLLLLFGLGGMTAAVALVVGVYLFFEDVVQGTVGSETLRSMRVPIGILLSTGAIAAYHWTVNQRSRVAVPAAADGPRYVLLVGPSDPDIARAVAHATGGRVQAWSTEGGGTPWSVDAVLAALAAAPDEEVLVLSDTSGVHAIPVHRR